MFLKKLFKKIPFLLFFIGFFFIFKVYTKPLIIQKKVIKLENNYQISHYTKDPYIEFKNTSLKLPIVNSTDKFYLDQNYVGIWNENKQLEKVNNIVLAGHNTKNVFRYLHQIKLDEEIEIYYKRYKWTYKVKVKKIISINDFSKLMETNEKNLTLITCVNNKNKRLIVIATLV